MNYDDYSDCELIQMYTQGEECAFKTLLQRHQQRIYMNVLPIVRQTPIAEDIVQEAFLKAIRTIRSGRYQEEGKFLPWISRIAHNMAIDQCRRRQRHPTVLMEEGSVLYNTLALSACSQEDIQIQQETHLRLRTLIEQLPDTQREVLVMRHYMQMSFQEIAETTQVSINTALGRMRYALINLRRMMEEGKRA